MLSRNTNTYANVDYLGGYTHRNSFHNRVGSKALAMSTKPQTPRVIASKPAYWFIVSHSSWEFPGPRHRSKVSRMKGSYYSVILLAKILTRSMKRREGRKSKIVLSRFKHAHCDEAWKPLKRDVNELHHFVSKINLLTVF